MNVQKSPIMFEEYRHLSGKCTLYFIHVESDYYKFGITEDICQRLKTHKRMLNFCSVIEIILCENRELMFRTEQKFKKYAQDIGILCNKYGQTEIVSTKTPGLCIDWLKNEIKPNRVVETIQIMTDVPKIVAKNCQDNKKCYNCGKNFRTPAELQRHQKRKTPCLIREISEADKNNPNRCIYCNKVMSKKENLTRHLTKCKVKNGGIQTLYDKVKYEETIRIMKEEQERKDQELNERIRKLEEREERLKVLEEQILKMGVGQMTINNTIKQ